MSYDYERRIFGSVFGGNSKWIIALDSKGLVNTEVRKNCWYI